MAGYKDPDFNERAAAAGAAKQRALDLLRNRPAPDPAAIAARQAARAARDAAATERRSARQAAAEAAKLAKAASKQERRAGDPGPSDADLKAARDARYAARKGRKR